MDPRLKTIALTLLGLAASGSAYFYGTGLHPHWWLTWLAPLPVLMLSPRLPFWYSAIMAFAAFVVQGLNMFTYYSWSRRYQWRSSSYLSQRFYLPQSC
jgi:apolipoprotein N-acyltransferase